MALADVLRRIVLARHSGHLDDDAYQAAIADWYRPRRDREPPIRR